MAKEETAPGCDFLHAHGETVERVRREMPADGTLLDLAELYKVFGDSTRIKILYALFEAELCVCDIAALLGMTVSAISHQLRILRGAKLVDCRREGILPKAPLVPKNSALNCFMKMKLWQ